MELQSAVDIDGVLADTHTSWCNRFNAQTGKHMTIRDIKNWTFWNDFGITEDDFLNIHAKVWDDWQSIPPTEKNLSAKVNALHQFGPVDILTARRKATVRPAALWLAMHRIPYRHLIVAQSTSEKSLLGYDVFVDDSDVVMSAVSKKQNTWGILYARPWTENLSLPPNVWRIHTWEEAPTILRKILEIAIQSKS